jgi:putative transposase
MGPRYERTTRSARSPDAQAAPRGAPRPGGETRAADGLRTRRCSRGSDATLFYTQRDGWCWFFGAIDHGVEDVVGWHVAKVGDRWAALEPIRQGVRQTHGGYAPKIALGLGLRMDHGPQYTAHQFLGELRWLGIRPTPSYVGEPQCNGIMERWIRTLKEECVYLHDFATLEETRQAIGEFIECYNTQWLLERHGHRTPAEVRQALTRQAA